MDVWQLANSLSTITVNDENLSTLKFGDLGE